MSASKQSKIFIYVFWILLFIVGYYAFNSFIQKRNNPNQSPRASIGNQGQYVVYLKANPNHAYIVNGFINQYPVKFLVDTGATSVVVPYIIAQKIGLYKGQSYKANTANGTIVVYDTKLNNLTIGNISLSGIRASINPSEKGEYVLLGMNALKKLEFHYKDNVLILIQDNK